MKTAIVLSAILAASPAAAGSSLSEVFELRTKCQALTDELADSLAHGPFWSQTATSNYSIRTQHCYAQIELSPADINISGDDFKQRTYLYVAHTKELLANVTQDGKKEYGMVYDGYYEKDHIWAPAAHEYIKQPDVPRTLFGRHQMKTAALLFATKGRMLRCPLVNTLIQFRLGKQPPSFDIFEVEV
jgi:hypothetical protein